MPLEIALGFKGSSSTTTISWSTGKLTTKRVGASNVGQHIVQLLYPAPKNNGDCRPHADERGMADRNDVLCQVPSPLETESISILCNQSTCAPTQLPDAGP